MKVSFACKGIIYTTSYEQLNSIRENISQENRRRLPVTDNYRGEGHGSIQDAMIK
ncbi:MAG: hypothetical protein WAM14_14790 [Candidatus Nitrosopolaris sp.]